MSLNLDKLKSFRTGEAPAVWTPPSLSDYRPGKVIAFDQSLGACAVVALWCTHPEGRPPVLHVNAAETFRTESTAKGHEGNFQRTMDLTTQIGQWMSARNFAGDWQIVHEAPPSGGGTIRHPESSILASVAVRYATHGYTLRPMVNRQAHAKLICGDGNADKKTHHAALKRLMTEYPITNADKITNEGKRDALSLGLCCLARRQQRGRTDDGGTED